LDHQNNFETLKIMSNAVKNFDILVNGSTLTSNYFSSTKLLF